VNTTDPKTSAPTSNDRRVLVADQRMNRLYLVDLSNLRATKGITSADFVWRNADGTPVEVPTGAEPRGVVQGRFGRVWVACKGGNCDTDSTTPRSELRSYYMTNGQAVDRLTGEQTVSLAHRVPFGLRGVCIDPHFGRQAANNFDEVWATCFGSQLQGGTPCTPPASTGDGYSVIRIRDDRGAGEVTPLGAEAVSVIVLGDETPKGPFGIASTVRGDKYIACAISKQLWKLTRNQSFSTLPDGRLRAEGNAAGPNWPVDLSTAGRPDDGPLSVSIDGNGKIWVQFKETARLVRVNSNGSIEVDCQNLSVPDGFQRPENLGDFTGYWTAAGLFPCDDSNCDCTDNLVGLLAGVNPFVRFDSRLNSCSCV
jgi:hypothetical protein